MLLKTRHTFVLECLLYNPIGDKVLSVYQNLILESLKSFFQLGHQVDICLYLMKDIALHHSREIVDLKPS
jgi:hypothetical protein